MSFLNQSFTNFRGHANKRIVVKTNKIYKNHYDHRTPVKSSVGDPDPQDPHVLGLLGPDPNPLVTGMDPDPDPNPSVTGMDPDPDPNP